MPKIPAVLFVAGGEVVGKAFNERPALIQSRAKSLARKHGKTIYILKWRDVGWATSDGELHAHDMRVFET